MKLSSRFKLATSNKKGISMVALIITVIIIIIIAAIAIYGGLTRNIEETSAAKMLNEFSEVENAIAQRGQENRLDSNIYPYISKTKYTDEDNGSITINNIKYGEGYYLVTRPELEQLGVTGVDREFVVNYNTGEVVLKNAYYYADKQVYTKDDLINAYTESGVISTAEYDEVKGVNKPLLLEGMLPVINNGSSWVVVSADSEDWYDYALDEKGGPVRYANVMLLDDVSISLNGRRYTNEEIRSMDITDLVGGTISDGAEGSMFIWIPRYTYKEEADGSKSIVYSRLTADYLGNGYLREPAFYYGEYNGATSSAEPNSGYVSGGKELTGIWISKYVGGYLE